MINFFEFRFLPDEQQSDYILNNGVFLCSIDSEEERIGLFRLFDFFVEIYYNKVNDQIINIKSFRSMEFLEPYLERINISEAKAFL